MDGERRVNVGVDVRYKERETLMEREEGRNNVGERV